MKRRFLQIALALVATVVVGVLVLILRFPPDTWKDRALAELEARTGIQATAETASVSFFPLGLALGNVTVRDERPEAYQELDATIEAVVVQAELMSLVRGAPQVNEIRLTRPDVRIVGAPPATENAASSGPPVEAAAVLAMLAIEEGRLWFQAADGSETEVLQISQRGGVHLEPDGSYRGNVKGTVEAVRLTDAEGTATEVPSLEFALQASGTTDPPRGTVQIGWLRSAGLSLEGPLDYDLSSDRPALEATLAATLDVGTAFGTFRGQLPLTGVAADLTVDGGSLVGELTIAGPWPAAGDPDPFALLELVSGRGELQAVKATLLGQDLSVSDGTWSLQERRLMVDATEARAAALSFGGRLELPATGHGAMRFSGSVHGELAALRDTAIAVWPKLPLELTQDQLAPETWPRASGTVRGEVTAHGELPTVDPLVYRAELGLEGVEILDRLWRDPVFVQSGTLVVDPESIDFSQLEVRGEAFEGFTTGTLTGFPERMNIQLDAQMTAVDLDVLPLSFSPATETSWWPWTASVAWAKPEPWIPPETLHVRANVQSERVTTSGMTFDQVDAVGELIDQRLTVPQASGQLHGGEVKGNAVVDWTAPTAQWEAEATTVDVPASPLLKDISGPLSAALSTQLSTQLKLSGVVGEPSQVQSSLTGGGQLTSSEGAFQTEAVVGDALDTFLGAFAPQFQSLDFNQLTGALTFDQGKVGFDEVLFHGATSLRVSGWVGLDGESTQMRWRVVLPKDVTPQLGSLQPVVDLMRDPDGRFPFDVVVSGRPAKPKVQIDLDQLATRAIERGGDQALDRLGDLLPGGLGEGAAALDSLQNGVEEGLNDLLGRFRRRK